MKKKLLSFVFVIALISQGVTALQKDDLIELSSMVNARENSNFQKNAHNIKKMLPAGTTGKIEEKKDLPSGNYGLKIIVTSGENKDQSFWVYYNKKNPLIKLSKSNTPEENDFTNEESIEKAKSARLTKAQIAIVANAEQNAKASIQNNLPSMKKDIERATNPVSEEYCADCAQLKLATKSKPVKNSNARLELIKNFADMEGDPVALKQALCFFDKNKKSKFKTRGAPGYAGGIAIANDRYITINDLNKSSRVARMYLLDTETGKVKAYSSGHGAGGGAGVPENDDYQATHYSNTNGSNATPRGFFITGNTYSGKFGYSLKLHGLQQGINDNTFLRAVVMHGFDGVNPAVACSDDSNPKKNLRTPGDVQVSYGCTELAPERTREVIDSIKEQDHRGGSLYYNYTQEEKALGGEYCGDSNLMVSK